MSILKYFIASSDLQTNLVQLLQKRENMLQSELNRADMSTSSFKIIKIVRLKKSYFHFSFKIISQFYLLFLSDSAHVLTVMK